MASCNAWSIWGQKRLPIVAGIGSKENKTMNSNLRVITLRWRNLVDLKASFEVWSYFIYLFCGSFGMRTYRLKQNSENETQWVIVGVSYAMRKGKTWIIYSFCAILIELYCLVQNWPLELSLFILALWSSDCRNWWRILTFHKLEYACDVL